MKIACLQLEVKLDCPEENFAHVIEEIEKAALEKPDVIVLPETWNTGFLPKEHLPNVCDRDGERVKREIGALAAKHNVNIVAGSVSNLRDGKAYNTAFIFDRQGNCIASYDKIHLFTHMHEEDYYSAGDHLCRFELDGVKCGIIICYDIRFPELARSLAVAGMDVMFVVCQWPKVRDNHLKSLIYARAVENQMFVVCCNSIGKYYDGFSAVIDPWGEPVAQAGDQEQLLLAECNLENVGRARSSIPVFQDRRPDLY